MKWIIFVGLMIMCIMMLMCYALLVIASDADDEAEAMYQKWEKKPKTEPQEEVTTCVSIPLAMLEAKEWKEREDADRSQQ